jgi:hypothetical protein
MLTPVGAAPAKVATAVDEFGTTAGDQLDAVFQSPPGPAHVWAAAGDGANQPSKTAARRPHKNRPNCRQDVGLCMTHPSHFVAGGKKAFPPNCAAAQFQDTTLSAGLAASSK